MAVEDQKEYIYKLVILGDSAVGKTSLINQFIEGSFQEDYKPTLGANIVRKDISIEEINAKVRLIIWDLAGQEKYSVIRSMYYQGCQGALLVFDLTRYNTFENIERIWLNDFKNFVKKEGVYILIGNKVDLTEERVVSKEDSLTLAEKINAIEFIETSAKNGENVEAAFLHLVTKILND